MLLKFKRIGAIEDAPAEEEDQLLPSTDTFVNAPCSRQRKPEAGKPEQSLKEEASPPAPLPRKGKEEREKREN